MSDSEIQSASLSLTIRKSTDFVKIKWETYWEYLFFAIGSTLQCNSFGTFVADPRNTEIPTLVHFTICFVCVGLPVLYMQLVIGQFTQLGPIHFKYINPLTHGLGYMFMINTGIKCIRFGLQLVDFYLYLLMSLARILAWTKCPPRTDLKCWDVSKLEQKNYVIEPGTQLSAYIFWKQVYMKNVDERRIVEAINELNFHRCVTSAVVWFFTYLLLVYGTNNFKKVIKVNVYVIDICIVSLIVVAFCHSGAMPGLNHMFLSKFNQFMSIKVWYICINYLLELIAMGRGIHILCGNLLNPTANTSIISIGCILMTIVHTFAASLVTNLAIGIISYNANLEGSHFDVLIRTNYTTTWFIIIPQALGLVATPQLWTILYFFMYVLILTNNQLTHLFVIERCIMDAYPRLIKYRRYVLAIMCLLYFLFTLPLTSKGLFSISVFLTAALRPDMELFTVTVMTFCVSYIYGVQKLSDDIHFFLGSQPAKFWKVCWYSIPVVLMITFLYVLASEFDVVSENFQIGRIILTSIYLLPIPISFVVEFFRHLRDHNLVGLFKPSERWGPADPEERHLRKIFNPREEIRSRRRKDTCPHNCLINNKLIKKILDAEKRKRKEEFGVD